MQSLPIRALVLVAGLTCGYTPETVFAADGLTLEVTVPEPVVPSKPFRPKINAADFLGVSVGPGLADVRQILEGQGFSAIDTQTRYLLDEYYHDVEIVASGPNRRIVSIEWSGPPSPDQQGESIIVEFTSPMSGQHAMIVRRIVAYKKGSEPPLAVIRAAIFEKFGTPSRDGGNWLEWNWEAGTLVPQTTDDKRMAITIETRGEQYVERVDYRLTDRAAQEADRLRMNEFVATVSSAAKELRDAQATKPRL